MVLLCVFAVRFGLRYLEYVQWISQVSILFDMQYAVLLHAGYILRSFSLLNDEVINHFLFTIGQSTERMGRPAGQIANYVCMYATSKSVHICIYASSVVRTVK